MNVHDPRCPSCGAPQKGVVRGTTHRCIFCKHEFVVPEPATSDAARVPSAASARPKASAAIVVASLVGALCVTFGVGLVLSFRANAPEPEAAVAPGASFVVGSGSGNLPPVDVAPAAAPSAALGQIVEGNTSIGGRFFLVEYRNVGTLPIVQPSVVASGFDASGRRVVEQPGYAIRSTLAPGESTVILVLIAEPPADLARTEIALRGPDSGGYAPAEISVEIRESAERPTYGTMHELVGTVRNPSDRTLAFVRVLAIGRDEQGRPVSFADGMPSATTLAPGAESGFDVDVGTFEVARPARWEIIGLGRPM